MSKAKSTPSPMISPNQQVLYWTIRGGEVVDRLSDGTYRPWDGLDTANLPIRLGHVNAAVRELNQQRLPVGVPKFSVGAQGSRHALLGEFPSPQNLIMVYTRDGKRDGLRRTKVRVFRQPGSKDPALRVLSREVVAALKAEVRRSNPRVAALIT